MRNTILAANFLIMTTFVLVATITIPERPVAQNNQDSPLEPDWWTAYPDYIPTQEELDSYYRWLYGPSYNDPEPLDPSHYYVPPEWQEFYDEYGYYPEYIEDEEYYSNPEIWNSLQ